MKHSFWYKVKHCKHEHLSPDYNPIVHCWTPYCTASESHCLDCGVYIRECGCGSENGLSGWSVKRHRKEAIMERERC